MLREPTILPDRPGGGQVGGGKPRAHVCDTPALVREPCFTGICHQRSGKRISASGSSIRRGLMRLTLATAGNGEKVGGCTFA
jgi:hypothetical protein